MIDNGHTVVQLPSTSVLQEMLLGLRMRNYAYLFLKNSKQNVRFEVFTAVTMKNAVFWDVAPCSFCVNRSFGGTHRLRLQGRKIREPGTSEQVAASGSSLANFSTLKMEAIRSSETSLHIRIAVCHIPEDGILQQKK
jgi:hypothetical protein